MAKVVKIKVREGQYMQKMKECIEGVILSGFIDSRALIRRNYLNPAWAKIIKLSELIKRKHNVH